jgi:hypothetical protein
MRHIKSVITGLVLASITGVLAGGCTMPAPNDAEIGCAYNGNSSHLCPNYDAGVAPVVEAGMAPPSTDSGSAAASDGAMPEGGGGGAAEAGPVSSGLGTSCATSASACTGLPASYCLVSPTGGFSSFCTIAHCTEAECGSSYVCCDCSMSPISLVNTFPPGICVLPKTAAALPSYGCTCLPQQ